jgi:hypothetical protein
MDHDVERRERHELRWRPVMLFAIGLAGCGARTALPVEDVDSICGAMPVGTSRPTPTVSCAPLELGCGGVCVDPRSDRRNCGACGHDCQGGACSAGACQPITLASNLSGPCAIVLDATTLYFAALDGKVMKCAKTGCNGQPIVLMSGLGDPAYALAVDGTNVYAAESQNPSRVVACAISGCPAPKLLTTSATAVGGLAVDSENVYFTTLGGVPNPTGGTVSKCSIQGCNQPAVVAPGLDDPAGIVIDAANAYFTNASSNDYMSGTVMTCSLDGCAAPTTLASGQTEPNSIAVDQASVYWTNPMGNTVMRAARDGSTPPKLLASGQSTPYTVALDCTTVYWTNLGTNSPVGDGSVMKCAKRGCATPSVIASGLSNPCGIAVDATSVYWTTFDAVMKVAK